MRLPIKQVGLEFFLNAYYRKCGGYNRLIASFQQGESYREIGRMFNVTYQTILLWTRHLPPRMVEDRNQWKHQKFGYHTQKALSTQDYRKERITQAMAKVLSDDKEYLTKSEEYYLTWLLKHDGNKHKDTRNVYRIIQALISLSEKSDTPIEKILTKGEV